MEPSLFARHCVKGLAWIIIEFSCCSCETCVMKICYFKTLGSVSIAISSSCCTSSLFTFARDHLSHCRWLPLSACSLFLPHSPPKGIAKFVMALQSLWCKVQTLSTSICFQPDILTRLTSSPSFTPPPPC